MSAKLTHLSPSKQHPLTLTLSPCGGEGMEPQ